MQTGLEDLGAERSRKERAAGPSADLCDSPVELSTDEVAAIRQRCCLAPSAGSPFLQTARPFDEEGLQRLWSGLSVRRLTVVGGRLHRDLVRRLLIVAQPDSRIVLLRAAPGHGERLVDIYERSGAYLEYERQGDEHEFGVPYDHTRLLERLLALLGPSPRVERSRLDLKLTNAEYLALAEAGISGGKSISRKRPPNHGREVTMDGLAGPGAPPVGAGTELSEREWQSALSGLIEKGIAAASGDELLVQEPAATLALALSVEWRHVLSRFDYTEPDWCMRDATFIVHENQVFWLKNTSQGDVLVRELDASGLERLVRTTLFVKDEK